MYGWTLDRYLISGAFHIDAYLILESESRWKTAERKGAKSVTLETTTSARMENSGEHEDWVEPPAPPYFIRGTWPYFLLIVGSGLFISVEALGIFQQGLSRYLYLGACMAIGALGIIGLFVWVLSEASRSREYFRLARLVATGDEFHSEVESKSYCFYQHWKAVSRWADMIAREMGLPETEIRTIRRAAEVMDIGMLDLMDEISESPADERLRKHIEGHPVMSENVLKTIHPGWDIIPLVRHHHERFDGAGYPDGLRGEEIPIGARILAVSDSLVAMASERSFRGRRKPEDIGAELHRCSGSQFDPRCIEALMRVSEGVLGAFEEPRGVLS